MKSLTIMFGIFQSQKIYMTKKIIIESMAVLAIFSILLMGVTSIVVYVKETTKSVDKMNRNIKRRKKNITSIQDITFMILDLMKIYKSMQIQPIVILIMKNQLCHSVWLVVLLSSQVVFLLGMLYMELPLIYQDKVQEIIYRMVLI